MSTIRDFFKNNILFHILCHISKCNPLSSCHGIHILNYSFPISFPFKIINKNV